MFTVFVKGHALIQSGKWEGHDFIRKKFLKYPGSQPPPPPVKNVPSLKSSLLDPAPSQTPVHWVLFHHICLHVLACFEFGSVNIHVYVAGQFVS